MKRYPQLAWCFYDWAHSAFSTIIITFVFSVYFSRGIVGDETQGAGFWSLAMGASGFVVAVLSPYLGWVSDITQRRLTWIAAFTIAGSLATAFLFIGEPDASYILILTVLILAGVANASFEFAWVFANSLLPGLSKDGRMGTLSGRAWAFGYAGGLIALVLTLLLFVGIGDIRPLLPIAGDKSENIRATSIFAALWIIVFSLPLFFWIREEPNPQRSKDVSFKQSFSGFLKRSKEIFRDRNLMLFLIASAIYRDGLVTLFAVGGVFAAAAFDMSFHQILLFAIGLNVTAAIGAFSMVALDDKKGSKYVVLFSLTCLAATGTIIVFLQDATQFIIASLFLGLFIGPVQAASRTMAASLAQPGNVAQVFGFYTLTGKSLAFIGPLIYGWLTLGFDNARAGLASIIMFWILGAIILACVRKR